MSDLVTLGSPLGKADLLLADDAAAFERRKNRREFPVDPPLFEYWSERNRQFSYPEGKGARIPITQRLSRRPSGQTTGFPPRCWFWEIPSPARWRGISAPA